MRRVLLVGGSSYIAQFLVQQHLQDNDEQQTVVACTLRASQNQSTVPVLRMPFRFAVSPRDTHSPASCGPGWNPIVWVFGGIDVNDPASLCQCIDAFDPHVVINCVAMSSPAICERDPEQASALNEPYELVQHLRNKSIRLIHFSTDFVYDGESPPETGYKEEDAILSPTISVYSRTKLRFDRSLLEQRDLDAFVLRISNVLGPRAPFFPDQSPKFMQWLHNELFLSSPAANTTPVTLWTDEIRSFLYVGDLARIVWRLVAMPTELYPCVRLFNVGGTESLSRLELGERYQRIVLASSENRNVTTNHRQMVGKARASIQLGYHAPLNATIDSSLLRSFLPADMNPFTDMEGYMQGIMESMTKTKQ